MGTSSTLEFDLVARGSALRVNFCYGHFGGLYGVRSVQAVTPRHRIHGADLCNLWFGTYGKRRDDQRKQSQKHENKERRRLRCPSCYAPLVILAIMSQSNKRATIGWTV